jgi:hypothetical protein
MVSASCCARWQHCGQVPFVLQNYRGQSIPIRVLPVV